MDPEITSRYHQPLSWLGFIFAVSFMLMGVFDGLKAFKSGFRKNPPKVESDPLSAPPASEEWDLLCSRGRRVIDELIAQFPPDIAHEAAEVPVLFEERARNEGAGYRTLGRYHNFSPGRKSEYKGPIFLYLKTIEESAARNEEDFESAVKTTYLHELGHHFGWDEVDLVRHGLPSGRPPGQ